MYARKESKMKKGIFIYNPKEMCEDHVIAWKVDNLYNSFEAQQKPTDGLTMFRKEFDAKDVVAATLELTSLGIVEAYVNGVRVGERVGEETVYDELKPGWTDYNERVFEFTYDVTHLIRKGINDIVLIVSKGWWGGRISFGVYGNRPTAACACLALTKKNGECELVATDTDWSTTIGGPVLAADIYDGEYYDSRITPPYVDASGFTWEEATVMPEPFPQIIAPVGPRILERNQMSLRPISATVYCGTIDNGTDYGEINVTSKKIGTGCENMTLNPGETLILDFGQNQVGRPEIVFSTDKDCHVCGYFAELLNDSGAESRGNDGPKGSLYVKNYRSARAKYNYIASGDKEESYKPLFTFYGYRYFMLRADKPLSLKKVTALVVGSDIEEIGSIRTSHHDVNKLISNVLWGQRSNYLSIPTDCPQRDERLGWTGDTQIFCTAGAYNGHTLEFMRKWMGDVRASQKLCKGICDVIPKTLDKNNVGAGSAWGDAAIIVPYKMWLMFADKTILKENFDAMETYMEYLEQFGYNGPIPRYGDWLNYEKTPKEYISMCYYYYDAILMKKISDLIGRKDRKHYYGILADRIKEAYLDKYVPGGEFECKTQTGYLLPLAFGLVEGELRAKAIKELKQKIIDNDYTLSTGFVGTGVLCQTLSECGLDDLAYSLLLQTKDPSWLYSVHQGATTVWERWNSYTLEKGFGDVGMNSFNHYAYGVVLEWMYSYMAGIAPNTQKGGFTRLTLRPTPDRRRTIPKGQQRITSCEAEYKTENGVVKSAWEIVGDKTVYSIVIPEGSEAEVKLACRADAVLNVNDVEFTRETLGAKVQKKRLVFKLGAGTYKITV